MASAAHLRAPKLLAARPSTAAQREASRRNGARSHGPVTHCGKQNSARNSVRHGLYARTATLPPATAEAAAIIREDIVAAAQPHDAAEQAQAEFLAIIRIAEYAAMETETRLLSAETERQRALNPAEPDESLLAIAFRHLCDHSRVLDKLSALQARLSNRYDRESDKLARLQITRHLRVAPKIEIAKTNLTTFTKHTAVIPEPITKPAANPPQITQISPPTPAPPIRRTFSKSRCRPPTSQNTPAASGLHQSRRC